jgi:hypothetical protein
MPYTFDFDITNRILRCRLKGQVTDEILKEFFRIGAEHAIRTQPSAGVVDFSDVTSFEVSTPTLQQLAKAAPVLNDPHLRRVVVAPSPEIYGLMRMFQMQGEQKRPNIHVVRAEREAWAILAVRKPRFESLKTE